MGILIYGLRTLNVFRATEGRSAPVNDTPGVGFQDQIQPREERD